MLSLSINTKNSLNGPRINYKCSLEKVQIFHFLNDVPHKYNMNIIDWDMVNCITDDKNILPKLYQG